MGLITAITAITWSEIVNVINESLIDDSRKMEVIAE